MQPENITLGINLSFSFFVFFVATELHASWMEDRSMINYLQRENASTKTYRRHGYGASKGGGGGQEIT